MMVDVSHAADKTFYDVLAATTAPVIASHSSMRAIEPPAQHDRRHAARAWAGTAAWTMINYEAAF